MVRRVGVLIEIAFILFAVCAGVGGAALYLAKQRPEVPFFILAISLPALASIALVLVGALVPALFSNRRLTFPENITMPLVHVVLLFAVVQLVLTRSNPLEELPHRFSVAGIWQQPAIVLLSFIAESVVLSAILQFSKNRSGGL